jgi:hypothetical protein
MPYLTQNALRSHNGAYILAQGAREEYIMQQVGAHPIELCIYLWCDILQQSCCSSNQPTNRMPNQPPDMYDAIIMCSHHAISEVVVDAACN